MIACKRVVSFTFLCLSVVTDTVTRKALYISQEIFHMVGKKCLCKGWSKNNTPSTSHFLSLNIFLTNERCLPWRNIKSESVHLAISVVQQRKG